MTINSSNRPLQSFALSPSENPPYLNWGRAPTATDFKNPGTRVQDNSVTPPKLYETTGAGSWFEVTAGSAIVSQLDGNSGSANPVSGIINIVGTAGTNVAGAGNTLTITATPSTFSWNIGAVGLELVPENAYTITGGAQNFTLPAACAIGDEIGLVLQGGTSWTITPSGVQTIQVGPITAAGAGGSVASTTDGDTVWIVCTAVNSTWLAFGYTGSLNVTP